MVHCGRGQTLRLHHMNTAIDAPDAASRALLGFLEGRGGTARGQRAILAPAGAPGVAPRMDRPNSWSLEIVQGRVTA